MIDADDPESTKPIMHYFVKIMIKTRNAIGEFRESQEAVAPSKALQRKRQRLFYNGGDSDRAEHRIFLLQNKAFSSILIL
jgi:hypothetical protein